MPGFVDPGDPSKLWIDWDARVSRSTPRRGSREARVRRAVAERTEHKFDSTLDRLGNPFAGKLRPEDEPLVEERARATTQAREAKQQEQCAEHRRQQADRAIGRRTGTNRQN